MTFGQKTSKLNSRPVYCSWLYICFTYNSAHSFIKYFLDLYQWYRYSCVIILVKYQKSCLDINLLNWSLVINSWNLSYFVKTLVFRTLQNNVVFYQERKLLYVIVFIDPLIPGLRINLNNLRLFGYSLKTSLSSYYFPFCITFAKMVIPI